MAGNKTIAQFEIQLQGKNISVVQKDLKKTRQEMDKTSDSAKKGSKQIDKYGRGVKGAAGISSGASKNFSKMQQNIGGNDGSGGLVRAYALLAANVFALTAAFGVLQRSAQVDQLTQSMEILSTRGGTSIDVLSRKIVEASGGAVDLASSFRQVSLASSAGLNTQEIEGLTMVAKGAAISLGRDLPDAMDRIFRGAIKLEPEILDEIGLFVRVDEAARKYAQGLGRTVTSLSQADKRQAFLNEILDQGTRKFQEYAEAVQPDAFTRLAAALRDIAQNLTSFLNSGLGPLVNFLADNTGLLTGIFVLVAGSLLKQAIPAIGQFNAQVAEGAVLAQQEAEEYIKGVEQKSLGAVKGQRKIQESIKKTAKAEAQSLRNTAESGKRFKSQANAAKDIEKNIQKAQRATTKKKAVDEKIKLLMEAQEKVQARSKKLIEDELKILKAESAEYQKQINAEKELVRLKKGAKTQPGTLADRTGQQLATQATVAGGVSMVSGIAETQGLTAGFKELGKAVKDGKIMIDGVEKPLKGFGRAAFAARGSVSLLAVGIQNLMAAAMPFILVGGLLAGVLYGIGKAYGVGREESKKLTEEIKNATSISKNLSERYGTQIFAVNNATLSFIEQNKALLAFNKQAAEATGEVLKINERLKDFRDTSTSVSKAWQGLLAVFGLDQESIAIKAQSELVEQTLASLKAQGDDVAELFNDGPSFIFGKGDYQDEATLKNLGLANKTLGMTEKAIKSIMGKEDFRIFEKLRSAGKGNQKSFAELNNELRKSEGSFLAVNTESSRLAFKLIKAQNIQEAYNDSIKGTVFSEKEAVEASELINRVTDERAKRLGSFVSAVEGANEAVGKFQASFLPKTKADEIIGSLTSITATMNDLTKPILDEQGNTILDQAFDPEKVKDFLKSVEEGDNPLGKLLNTDDLEKLKTALKDEDMKTADGIIEDLTTSFLEFQFTVIAAKNEIKTLQSEIKTLGTFQKAGADTGVKATQKEIELSKQNLLIAEANTNMQLRSVKLTRTQGEEVAKEVKNAKTHADLQEVMTKFKLTETQALAISAAFTEENLKLIEKEVKEKQKSTLESQKQVEALIVQQKAAEKRFAVEKKTAELTSELARLNTGITDPIKVADVQLQNAVKETKLKQDGFKLQARLQQIQFKLLELELQVLKEKGIINEQELTNYTKDIKKASADLEKSLTDSAKNAGLEFIKTVATSGGSGQKALVGVAQTLGSRLSARQTRIDDLDAELNDKDTSQARKDAINAELESLKALNLGYIALKDTLRATGEQMKQFGPEGEFAAAISIGMANILDGADKLSLAFDENSGAMERGAAVAEFASTALSSISNMMQMNSQAQIAAVDSQIAAEKKRDGKSAESIAKINALEKKKEAIARKNFERQKKMQMAQAVMSTASAIMQTAASNMGAPWALPLMATMAAMGAMQLAVISKQKYNGPTASTAEVSATSLQIGKRGSAVDVAKAATSGELNYLRGGRTDGTNLGGAGGNLPGASMGRKGYADGGVVVGERGPEIITPAAPVDVTPNYAINGQPTNVNFTINAVDAAGVEDVLMNQRGNLIRMIREAANENGERFLETVDTQSYGSNK